MNNCSRCKWDRCDKYVHIFYPDNNKICQTCESKGCKECNSVNGNCSSYISSYYLVNKEFKNILIIVLIV